MIHPKVDIHDILRHVIENMENRVFFQDVTDNGDNTYTVTACNTMWAMNGEKFTWDGNEYTISEVDPNVSFLVSGDVAFNPVSYIELNAPNYFHGTIKKTNNELNEITIGRDKFPMLYCFEVFRETYYQLKSDRRERTTSLRLFFLTSADKENWLTEDHYEKVIIPTRNMVESFIEYVDNKNGFSKLSDYDTVNRVDFGTFTQDNGNLKNLFTDHLSGIELDIDLEINKDLTCTLSCPCPAPIPPSCPVATYKNSDGSFTIQIDSATTYTSDDIEVTLNGVSQGNFPSNIDIDLTVSAPDATYQNSDGSFIQTIPSGDTFTSDDIDITLNSGVFLTIPSNNNQDIELVDQDDNPITPDSIVGNKITVTAGGACTSYQAIKTGQTTSYYPGNNDDGGLQYGRGVDFVTLDPDNLNPAGGSERFTDELMGQAFTNNIFIDWQQRDDKNQLVLGYTFANLQGLGGQQLAAWLSGQPYTFHSFGNWYVANKKQGQMLVNDGATQLFNYAPINNGVVNGATVQYTSTTRSTNSAQCWMFYIGNSEQWQASALFNSSAMFIRYFTYAELGL